MPMSGSTHSLPVPPRRQHGAVLYIALIMLVLLALLGLVGMRVAGLQERMSANYRDVNLAFQEAELGARDIEANILETLNGNQEFKASSENCQDKFNPATWASLPATNQDSAQYVKRIDKCFPQSEISEGGKVNDDIGNIYQITALRSNGRGASAVIDTVYIPQ